MAREPGGYHRTICILGPEQGSSLRYKPRLPAGGYEGVAYEARRRSDSRAYATVGTSRAIIDLTPIPSPGAARKGLSHTTGYGTCVNAHLAWQ